MLISPEQVEFERKQIEAAEIEAELIEAEEIQLSTRADADAFTAEYIRRTSPLFQRREELGLQLARRRHERSPSRETQLQFEAAAASCEGAQFTGVEEPRGLPPPSAELRAAFRAAALSLHPDLATSEDERVRRTALMATLNDAYQRRDLQSVLNITALGSHPPEAIQGDGVALALVRTIRKIAQMRARLDAIRAERQAFETGAMWELFCLHTSRRDPPSVIDEVIARIGHDILRLERQIGFT